MPISSFSLFKKKKKIILLLLLYLLTNIKVKDQKNCVDVGAATRDNFFLVEDEAHDALSLCYDTKREYQKYRDRAP